jgi:CHAT domain-containing protein/Flp pilus assembly protein TadD
MWVEIEQAPRGDVRLLGERGKEKRSWLTEPGLWGGRISPRFQPAMWRWSDEVLKELANGGAIAMASQEPGIPMTRLQATSSLPAWSTLMAARASTENGDPNSTERLYLNALQACDRTRDKLIVLGLYGGSLSDRKAFGHAEEVFRIDLGLAESSKSGPLSLARAQSNLAVPLWQLGKKDEADRLLGAAYNTYFKLAPQAPDLVKLLRNMGMRAEEKGEIAGSLEFHRKAVNLAIRYFRETDIHADCLIRLGTVERDTGSFKDSMEHLGQALRIRQRLEPKSLKVSNVFNEIGLLHKYSGDLDEALEDFQKGLDIAKSLPNSDLHVAALLNSLSLTAFKLGLWKVAESYSQQAVQIALRIKDQPLVLAVCLTNLAIAVENQGRYDEALSLYQRSLGVKRNNGSSPTSVAYTLMNMGVLSTRVRKLEQAEKYMKEALQIEEGQVPQNFGIAVTLDALGSLYCEMGDLERGLSLLARAIKIIESAAPQSIEAASILSNYGVALQRQGHIDQARTFFLRAVDILDSVFYRSSTLAEFRESFASESQEQLFNAVDHLILSGDLSQAFALMEHWRGRSLYSQILQRDLLKGDSLPKDLQVMLSIVERRISDLSLQEISRIEKEPQNRPASIPDQMQLALQQRDELLAEGKRANLSSSIIQVQGLDSLEKDRSALDKGTESLTYISGALQAYIFSSREGRDLRVQYLPVTQEVLRQRIERFRELIPLARPGSAPGELRLAEMRQLGKDLYDILLKPAEAEIEKAERVMIVADGPLHYLPFAALTREMVGADGVKHDQYVAEWKPLHSVLSATVFAELKKDRRDLSKPDDGTALQFVAFGDPVFPNSLTAKEPDKISDIRVRSAARQGSLELTALPNTRREVEGIAALFPRERVRTFLGGEATEEKAKAIGKGARILHFATHARLDDRFPLNSSLLLSMPEGFPEGRENGLLQVWEIFEQMRLDADLVVLSACDSGLGEEQGGEGLIGLTRAFQYAGARTVLASLWAVRDEATAELMIRFYRHLTAGEPKDRALQAAQRELLAGPIEIPGPDGKPIRFDATAPYYWAAFQVIGDWQ